MSTLTINWNASEKLRRAEAVANGTAAGKNRETVLDLTALTQAEREVVIPLAQVIDGDQANFRVYLTERKSLKDKNDLYPTTASFWLNGFSFSLDAPPTPEDVVAIKQNDEAVMAQAEAKVREAWAAAREAKAAQQAEFDRQMAIYTELEPRVVWLISDGDLTGLLGFAFPGGYNQNFPEYAPWKGMSDKPGLGGMISTRKKELVAAAEIAQKTAWINAHGSEHLKRGWAAGHRCDRMYWIERAGVEYPGFVLDYEKNADWKEVVCPSLAMLDARDANLLAHPGAKVEIVWLTSEPLAQKITYEQEWQTESEPFAPRQAIFVDDDAYPRYLVR